MRKIVLFIDSLGAGGAQRQIVNLAVSMAKHNTFLVSVVCYHNSNDFFSKNLEDAGVSVHFINRSINKSRVFNFVEICLGLYRFFSINRPELVLSFLPMPSLYSVIFRYGFGYKLVVGERSSRFAHRSFFRRWIFDIMLLFPNWVVCNSYNRQSEIKKYLHLSDRVSVIWNGFPIFENSTLINNCFNFKKRSIRLCVVGRISKMKNTDTILRAVDRIAHNTNYSVELVIIGRFDPSFSDFKGNFLELVKASPASIHILGELNDIYPVLSSCDFLIHASLLEGLPNVVCEAMINGTIPIVNPVFDNTFLVKDAKTGFYCGSSEQDIFECLMRVINYDSVLLQRVRIDAYNFALSSFDIDKRSQEYTDLFFKLLGKK